MAEAHLTRSSHLLVAYIFIASLGASTWVATDAWLPRVAWLAAFTLAAALWKWPFALDPPPAGVRIGGRDLLLTLAIAAPAVVNLAATWRQEFPTSGDQFLHNAYALEAYAFWWPIPFLLAVAAVILVVRQPESGRALAALAVLALLATWGFRGAFAERYPALLHVLSIPLRALLPAPTPIDVERLVNTLSIPLWLLVLRPWLIGRRVDAAALATGVMLFWQKDVVYYVTSGYLEPWAIVLLLTAGEHLLRFGREAIWRPLLLLGTAALIKDQAILTLPIVAALFFPRRERLAYMATVAAAATPFALYAAHPMANVWRGTAFVSLSRALGEHASLWRARTALQFGIGWPVAALAVLALLALAFRNRGAAALALAAVLDSGIFFLAAVQQPWAGYPRTSLIPFAFTALALGLLLERLPWNGVAIAGMAVLTAIPLAPFLRDAFAPSDARNFFEHRDAAIYFPVAEGLARLAPGRTVEILNNAKWIWPLYYPGPFAEQYPQLDRRYRVRVGSFRGMPPRCACTDGAAKLAVFIRFTNLGAALPTRPAVEAEAAECRAAMEATCRVRSSVVHDGTLVALLGSAR